MSKRKRQPDLMKQEARRLAKLPESERMEALAVHRRIADDERLSDAIRDHARLVAETLEKLIEKICKKK